MPVNLYYKTVLRRRNVWKDNLLALFEMFSSYPKLSLEVFIRKNFGHRYFKLSSAMMVASLLLLFPVLAHNLLHFISRMHTSYSNESGEGPSFWAKYATWYLFTIAFIFVSLRRHRESRMPTAWFDTTKFSLYSGDIDPRFYTIKLFKTLPTIRQIMIFYEPALFLVIGIVLWLAGQSLGWLLVMSSVFYSFSYASAYRKGDDFLWDIIDQIIMNRDLHDTVTNDLNGSESARMLYTDLPRNKEWRRAVVDGMIVNPNEAAVAL